MGRKKSITNEPGRIGRLAFWHLRNELSRRQRKELRAWRNASPDNETSFLKLTDVNRIRNDLKNLYERQENVWQSIVERCPELAVPDVKKDLRKFFRKKSG